MSKIVGIDLGSTLSEVAVIENGKPVVVANEDGSYTTPSVVSIKDGERKVGSAAKRQQIVNPKNTIYLIKRFMGQTYEEAQDAIKHMQYDVVDNNGKAAVKIDGRVYTPEEISSYIIAKMKKVAEDYVGETITDAVITCPSYFNSAAREATAQAGEIAGLNVLRVIAEPTASILSSTIDMQKPGKYMVTDIGGATTDFSVAEIENGVVEILSTNGDVFLGGSDIDKALADYFVSEFRKGTGVDISGDPQAMTRVLEAAEKAKIELTNSSKADINIPYITIKDNVPLHMTNSITRAKFEQLISWFVDKAMTCARKSVELAKINKDELDGILLIGGSCRIPIIQETLSKEFGVKLIKSSNMDLAVAEGAAIQANNIVGGEGSNNLLLLDVNPISLSIETMGGVATKMIEANTTIPCDREEVFSTAVDNQTSITVNVLQGERPMARDNKSLGSFNLDGILPARRGVPQLLVKFSLDANGVLSVTAKDKGTGKEQTIRIEGGSKLSEEEIERIKADAEKYAEEDKKKKEEADKINAADQFAFGMEKSLEDLGEKVTEEEKKDITNSLDNLRKAISEHNMADIDTYKKEVETKFIPISQRIYSSQSGSTSNNFSDANPFGDAFGGANPFNGANPFSGFNAGASAQPTDNAANNTENANFEEVKD